MEKPADQTDPVAVVNAVDLQSPDRKVVRRRFVQSTLFPLKPHDNKVGNCVKEEVKKVEVMQEDDDDDEEYCGSQEGKRKRGRKPKRNATPHKRGSKKVANGKDAPVVAVNDIEYPDVGSLQKLKVKQRVSTRNGKTNGNKGTSPAKIPTDPVATHQASQIVPDLWQEAKRTAEENSLLFAGKQLHPFFSSWKGGKKDCETTAVESNGCLDKRKERNAEFGPIHVFENVKDDLESIDWSNWSFYDGMFSKTACDQERTTSSFHDSIVFITSDTVNISYMLGTSLLLKGMSSGQYAGAHEDTSVIPTSVSPVVVHEEVTPHDLLKNIEKDLEVDKLNLIMGHDGHLSSDFEHQNAVLLERIMSYYLNRGNHPENSLWTNKYQPEKALEVCGNIEAVKFINEWLCLWRVRDFHVRKRSSGVDKCLAREDDYDPYDSESDVESLDEASGLKNVLLVTGPVGSGKSAAIYACAKEQGFQVVEVNASDWRNGALLKQKFGEAVGSHWLKRSQESPIDSQSKLNLKSSPTLFANGAAAFDLNHEMVEVTSEEEDSASGVGMHNIGDGGIPCDQSEIKTLILFEDVDATLCEDRGFISTIQQLADTGKRPMILTSNSENPVLPDNLDREEVCFTMPSLNELINHTYLVCAGEKTYIHPHLIKRCIQLCRGDIRKTLMHLQFWCQSQRCVEDGEVRSTCSPLMFNLDAGHFTLPKLIPFELPSSLSEFIEAEISKSLCEIRMEENNCLLEVIEEEVGNTSMQNNEDSYKDETASIAAKKEAILMGNCFLHLDDDAIAISNTCEFSNSSGSPVKFTRRNLCRKLDNVFSDSEDEIPNHENADLADNLCDDHDDNNIVLPAVGSDFPIPCSAIDTTNASGDPLFPSGAANIAAVKQSTATADLNSINFSALGDSCNRSNDNQHQLLQFIDVNQSSPLASKDSLKPLSGQLDSGEKKMEANSDHFPVLSRVLQNCLDPLSNRLQNCMGTKMAVNRCLFSQTPHTDPISCTVGSTWNQSINGLIHCGEAGMTELQHQHPEMETVNNQEAIDDSLKPLLDQFLCCEKANMENMEHQLLEAADVFPFSNPDVGVSFNLSSDQLFHSVEAKEEEIKHPVTSIKHISSAAMGDSLNQPSDQFLRKVELDEIQQQCPGGAGVNPISCSPVSDSSKQVSGQLHFGETKVETVQCQFPATVDVNLISCSTVSNYENPLNGKLLQLSETNAEEHQYEYSEATNGNHIIYRCQSVDVSCVPESTFVPETEVNDGKELPSGADHMEIVSPVSANTIDSSVPRHKASGYMQCTGSDINVNARDEETGDSQSGNEHLGASTSGCQVMDECSRMDFCKRFKSSRSSSLLAKNPIEERWNELRKTDLRQHSILENKISPEVLELAYGISNLISEADLLLHDCKLLTKDSINQEVFLDEETFTFGWHDQQVQMATSIAQHGYCLYAKDIDTLRSKMGIDNRVDLAWEMLASTNNSMAMGKLLRLDRSGSQISLAGRSLKRASPTADIFSKREREMRLHNIVLSTVPLKSHLSLRGNALRDYLSSLALISRSEACRLAEGAEKTKRRRVRRTKNYLISGGLDISPEGISMLIEYDSFFKGPSYGISR